MRRFDRMRWMSVDAISPYGSESTLRNYSACLNNALERDFCYLLVESDVHILRQVLRIAALCL